MVQLTISETIDEAGTELHVNSTSNLYLADTTNSIEVSVLLEYGAALLGDWCPTFRDRVLVSPSAVEKSLKNSCQYVKRVSSVSIVTGYALVRSQQGQEFLFSLAPPESV